MSSVEPFMPAHWSSPKDRSAEIDIDKEVDVIPPSGLDDAEAKLPGDSERPPFRTPVPGETLSEPQLLADVEMPEASPTHEAD